MQYDLVSLLLVDLILHARDWALTKLTRLDGVIHIFGGIFLSEECQKYFGSSGHKGVVRQTVMRVLCRLLSHERLFFHSLLLHFDP